MTSKYKYNLWAVRAMVENVQWRQYDFEDLLKFKFIISMLIALGIKRVFNRPY